MLSAPTQATGTFTGIGRLLIYLIPASCIDSSSDCITENHIGLLVVDRNQRANRNVQEFKIICLFNMVMLLQMLRKTSMLLTEMFIVLL